MSKSKIDPRKGEKLRRDGPAEPANTELKKPKRRKDPEINAPSKKTDDDEEN